MSRSYKKYPSGKCERSCKWGQRQANKKIRQTLQTISNGGSYKKLYNSWNICDYKFVSFIPSEWDRYKQYKRKQTGLAKASSFLWSPKSPNI